MEKNSYKTITVSPTVATDTLLKQIESAGRDGIPYLFVCLDGYDINISDESRRRMSQVARETGASLLYSDYRVSNPDGSLTAHPLAPYQDGSVRDDFDFGPMMLLDVAAICRRYRDYPENLSESDHSGLYALRLFIASAIGAQPISVTFRNTSTSVRRMTAGLRGRNSLTMLIRAMPRCRRSVNRFSPLTSQESWHSFLR